MTDARDAGPIPTAWCLITGPPSAGKTTLIEALAARGHRVVPEAARAHIAELGHTPAGAIAGWAIRRSASPPVGRMTPPVPLQQACRSFFPGAHNLREPPP